jgi:hypothetical protein
VPKQADFLFGGGIQVAEKNEQKKEDEPKLVSFRKLIEALEKEGLRVCDIHLEETGAPNYEDYKQFSGSVVIKTFPERIMLNG